MTINYTNQENHGYFHILIQFAKPIDYFSLKTEINLRDEKQIIESILIPYIENRDFLFSGYPINKNIVKRILIKKSISRFNQYKKRYENRNESSSNEHIIEYETAFTDKTRELIKKAEEKIKSKVLNEVEIFNKNSEFLNTEISINTKDKNNMNNNNRDVFIVHGHDENTINKIENLLRKLGLNPIILREQANNGKTIIEKLEDYTNVKYAIVLYTPCDEGRKKGENELNARARQNVVFEHGYLIGKLGRERVIALVTDDIEKPSDISGIVYIGLSGMWQQEVLRELRKYWEDLDANKLI